MSAATHEAFSFGGISRSEAVLWSTAAAVILSIHMAVPGISTSSRR